MVCWLFQIEALFIALAGVAWMLDCKAAASWLLRAVALLTIGMAIVQYFAGCLRASARTVSLGDGEVLAVLGIGGLALVGWLQWRRQHGVSGGRVAPRPQPRQRALPPPPLPEDAP